MNSGHSFAINVHKVMSSVCFALLCGIALGAAVLKLTGFWQGAGLFVCALVLAWKARNPVNSKLGEVGFFAIFGAGFLVLIALGTSNFAVAPVNPVAVFPAMVFMVAGFVVSLLVVEFFHELYCIFLFVNYGWRMKPREDSKRPKRGDPNS